MRVMPGEIETRPRFMVVKTQIVGNLESWSYDYTSDLELFADRQDAIDHGWHLYDHDDFNIATVQDGRLVAFGWDHEDFAPEDRDDLPEIERQLCLPDALKRLPRQGGLR